MNETKGAKLADRLKTAAQAKQALLAKFKPKAAVVDPLFAERGVEEAAELKAVRAERQAVRAVKREAADAVVAEAAAAAGERAERKRAKAPTEAEAKDKRDAKYAARKSRR
jgi:ABC-type amino acid transport substrate-binding protein